MWTFRPGYLGVTIAVIALLGGVLLGSLLNVSSHNETTTKYDYVSDISGLFDVSDEPQYIDYNPASNYTGYTNATASQDNPSGVKFDSTLISNNYRMITKKYTPVSGPNGTINNDSNYPQSNVDYDTGSGNRARGYITNIGEVVNRSNTNYAELTGFKLTSLYDWAVATFGDLSQYSTLTVNFSYPGVTAPTTRAYIGTVETYTNQYGSYNRVIPHYYTDISINASDQTFTVTGGGSGTYSLFSQYILYGTCTQGEVWITGSTATSRTYTTTLTLNYSSVTALADEYAYIVPSSGVTTSTATNQTIWDNDISSINYDNRAVDILVGPTFDNGSWEYSVNGGVLEVGLFNSEDAYLEGQQFDLMYFYEGTALFSKGWYLIQDPGTDDPIPNYLGDFKAVSVHLEKIDNGLSITAYGVTSFTTYLLNTVSPIASFSYTTDGGENGPADLDKLIFSSPGRLSWLITHTLVFMDTFNAVLVDPSINLANYWPDMSSYRYAFQSFALYGDSITINGVTYPVVNESITINDRAYKLDNFYLSFSEQGETSITFNNINRTIDLGPTVDKVVSFAGNWGFSAGLYEGHIDVKKVYDWNIKLLGDNLNTIILIAMGLGVVLMLACKWLGLSLRMTDKIVLAGAGLFMVLLLVV